ncbi:helix-turn-helix domain-containing protein [Actinomyces howellii]|nr:helix-turn-helix domain-containing protein [Actinomyces howellii]
MPKLVLAALADQADDDGWCWPSQATVAERCEMGERTVRRHIATLRDLGLLTPVARSSTWGRRSNGYQLHIGAQVDESLESRQPAKLAGCGEPVDNSPVDNLPEEEVFVENPATGQSGLLRNRPDWPVAQPANGGRPQEANGGRPQEANGGRLHSIQNHQLNHQTRPDQEVTSPAWLETETDSVGSGPGGVGPSSGEPAAAAPSASTETRRLIATCLPEHLRALDAAGARTVAGMLGQRLAAGWRPADIRSVMDQPLPDRVGRLSSLVAHRLRANVDPALAPRPQSVDQDAAHEERARRSEELAGTSRRGEGTDDRWAWAQVRGEMPGASRLEQAMAVIELVGQREAREGVAS